MNSLEVNKNDKISRQLGQKHFTQSLTKMSTHVLMDPCGNMPRYSTDRAKKIFSLLLYVLFVFCV